MDKQKTEALAVRFIIVLAVILIFGAFDYYAHSLSNEYSVPERYFRNKIIYGTLYGFIAYLFIRRQSLVKRTLIFSLTVSILLQIRYFLEGYPLGFVELFLGIHFAILLAVSYLAFKITDKWDLQY
jgi:hypothetical protein